ncbi:hypothetical protein QFC19_001551 [Naganishia cerealis]|uniref:Uncharacterized protein n=1 Tax=Naganishia cerealis TaxID=610337 RepID=A0ACC2WHX3_9TREE|nr:hypothetical protein QFC19_001551 [Naganishia cerealis]
MASTLRNRLSAVDEAQVRNIISETEAFTKHLHATNLQRAFARMANHELKTPMHRSYRLLAVELFQRLTRWLTEMSNYIEEMLYLLTESREQRDSVPVEVLQELEKYANGAQTSSRRMRHLLDAVTSYLEIGGEYGEKRAEEIDEVVMNVDDLLTIAMEDARKRETKNRHLAGDTSMDDVEMIVEIVPRETGTWLLTRDVNPLQNAIHQLALNACQATKTGYISLVCEDVSRKESVPEGYDASLPTSIISIRIQDTGSGMPQDFADHKIYQPYIKRDQNTPGAGLGVTLAHRTIDLMGGTLAFQSEPGMGTTALVEVPLKIKNEDIDSVIHERHFRGVECKICILGFDHHPNPGVRLAGTSLRNQIKALGVEVGQISDSDIIVIEAEFDIKNDLPEIQRSAHHRTLRIIRLGHTNMYNAAGRERSLHGDQSLPVEWLFRPVYPRLLRRIAMIPIDEAGEALLRQHDNAHNERDASSQIRWQREVANYNKSSRAEDFPEPNDNELRRQSLVRAHSPFTPNPGSRRTSNETSVKINARDLKVLVAEDDMINRKLLCGKLARMKVPSLQAENGQIAVDVYKQSHPKIVLMDIEMPVKSGFEASQGIRAYEKEANLPPCLIWAVTAKSDDVSKVYGLESCGINRWFTKPLKLMKLEDLIREKFDILAETTTKQ